MSVLESLGPGAPIHNLCTAPSPALGRAEDAVGQALDGQPHFFTAQAEPRRLSQKLTGAGGCALGTLVRGYVGCDIWLLSFPTGQWLVGWNGGFSGPCWGSRIQGPHLYARQWRW